ncbi:MAG: DNA ligase (ATP), variant 2 [Marteilia pararefringens]
MLLPHLDASRGSYSLKTINLAKLFIESYCYAPESSEYQMLIQYAREYHTADLSLTIHDLIRGSGQKSSIDIIEVDCLLQKLSESSLDSRRSDLKIHFRNVLSKMDALDHKWLTRLILKKIRIGCNESKILSCVSHDSIQVFNRTFSLQKVVERKFIELEEIEPSVLYGCAFRPMLCKRIFGEGQLQKLVNTDILWHCEMKYDGERIQLHKNQSHYSYFSRNGKEYSNVFGGSFNSGTLTRYIHSLFNEDIHSCILDGEMIGYSHNKQIYKTKSEQMEVKSFRNHSDYRPCFIAFDVLMVNDELFENKPLSERITRLNTIFTPRPGFLEYAICQTLKSYDSIYSYFESAIMANFEGIVLKDPASQYFFNARCEHWLKLKPDYLKESITDIDVICVGAYSNKGGKTNLTPSSCHLGQILKAQTYYTKFLCAVQISAEETSKQSVDAVHLLKAICVVGLGLSIDTLDYINSLIHETEGLVVDQQSDTNKMVLNSIDFSQYSPDIYLDYRKSFILQIKAAEFSVKPESQKLVSFRFPRAQRLRLDKTYSDCTSLGEIEEMIEDVCLQNSSSKFSHT